jgi:hypothetical protein
MAKKEKETSKKTEAVRSEGAGKRVCHSDAEFEEMFLPGVHEKKNIQEAIREPERLKEHFLRRIRK